MSAYKRLQWPPPCVPASTWKHSSKVRNHIERRILEFIRAAGLQPGQKISLYEEDYDAIARVNFNGVRVLRGAPRPRA